MHSNPDNDEVVHGPCVTSIPKESNHLGSPRCVATRGQEDHGGQHGPFPREYRPGLFIVTNIALIAARNNLLILKSGEPPFRQLTEFAPA
jgi:hypothetical protein